MQIFPSFEKFVELSRQGNVVPVSTELLADAETPVSAYAKLRSGGPAFLLESVEGGERASRYSFVGCNPRKVITSVGAESDGLRELQEEMGRHRPVEIPDLPPFTGGAVGFLGHEYVHLIENSVPLAARDDLGVPALWFMLCDSLVVFDRARQTMRLVANAHVGEDPGEAYAAAVHEIMRLRDRLQASTRLTPMAVPPATPPQIPGGNFTRAEFEERVRQAQEFIRAGDVFQVVLSQRLSRRFAGDALQLYRALRTVNPSPYMFVLETGSFALVGASPETHVKLTGGQVEIRPIAGTRPRGGNPEEDRALERELLADEKEKAEHLMLVDLARNDIGRVCAFGTVSVDEFMTVERYSHVMHIVSHVKGQLAPERSGFDLLRATFPAGTVSGAPKVRAMQIIAELEGTQRGTYAGALGYIGYNGNLDTCITLRTALVKDGAIHVQAGAGIVADSTPTGEFHETLNKASALFRAIEFCDKT